MDLDRASGLGFRAGSVATQHLNLIKDALTDFEEKVLQKYSEEVEEMEETEQKLTAKQFEDLYASFRTTIGRELTSGDYLNLFEKTELS